MAGLTNNFLRFNATQNKKISLVITIEGIPDKFSNRPIYHAVEYGDPGIIFGMVGLTYGALILVDGVRDYLSMQGSALSLSQRIEPEQGRGSVSTISLAFIDKDGYMTKVISPGVMVDEILGKDVLVEMGYEEISYPEDYFILFRGVISSVSYQSGLVTIQLSDPNIKRKQKLFYTATTKLTSGINASTTTIPVLSTDKFHQRILGPNGGYDSAIRAFIKIDDEYMEYQDITSTTSFTLSIARGAATPNGEASTAASHAAGATVTALIEIQDHGIDMALKLMLSGWNGYFLTGVAIESIVTSPVGAIAQSITLPTNIDADSTYGLTAGDYITISGATNPSNNGTRTIISFVNDATDHPRIIVLSGSGMVAEMSSPALLSLRSRYDTYPVTCGTKMIPSDVDVTRHTTLKTEFLGSSDNSFRFDMSAEQPTKAFIEKEIYLPMSTYSLTRFGRCSINITKPPLGSATLKFLTENNIINAENINESRGLNSRTFFNLIIFQYDFNLQGTYLQTFASLDTDSLNIIGISSDLTIPTIGVKTDFISNITTLLIRRAAFLLSRYRRGSTTITLTTNWSVGILLEAGDVVALNGLNLSIANFLNGTRNFGIQLFEVINRQLNIIAGTVSLTLVNGIGSDLTDRFGIISPSSFLNSGSTTTMLIIKDSFSSDDPIFPLNEPGKWGNYVGQDISVHNESYSYYEVVTFTGFDPVDNYKMFVSPPLSAPPPTGYLIDIPMYPTSTDAAEDLVYKIIHAHLDPQVLVATGISITQFTVAGGDAFRFLEGAVIRIHNATFTIDSGDKFISDVTGATITVSSSLGFTPSAGQFIELIGFADGGGPYRII